MECYLAVDTWSNKKVVVKSYDDHYEILYNGSLNQGTRLSKEKFDDRYTIVRELTKDENFQMFLKSL